MSETETSNGPSAEARLSNDLHDFFIEFSDSVSEEGLREIIQRHGLTLNNDYAGDYHFFFWACHNEKVNERIIQYVLEYFPSAARATNEEGITPLHAACNNPNVTLQIIQLLIDAAPDSVRSVDVEGTTPLHVLCDNDQVDNRAAIDILKLLIEKHPEAVRHRDGDDDLPIHIACVLKSPELCQVLIEAYPGSERIAGSCRRLPLHWACELNAVATVQYLYKLYPDAINHADTKGLYPIHCAITGLRKRADPEGAIETVQYLLDCDPNVKLQKRHGGSSLLRYACLGNYNDSNIDAALDVVKIIYDAHPEAIEDEKIARNIRCYHEQVQAFISRELVYARQANDHRLMTTPDEKGRLPLHAALQNNATLGSIELLVKGNPSALRASDNNFAMPLHIACEHHDFACVVQYLLDLDMRTLRAVDIDNNTALHYACRGAKYNTIDMLLENFDAISVSKRNSQKKLPIDLLWESNAVEDRESVEYIKSVFRLLKAYPETVMNVCTDAQSASDACLSQNRIGKKRKFGDE